MSYRSPRANVDARMGLNLCITELLDIMPPVRLAVLTGSGIPWPRRCPWRQPRPHGAPNPRDICVLGAVILFKPYEIFRKSLKDAARTKRPMLTELSPSDLANLSVYHVNNEMWASVSGFGRYPFYRSFDRSMPFRLNQIMEKKNRSNICRMSFNTFKRDTTLYT